jgi:hypothetical protein
MKMFKKQFLYTHVGAESVNINKGSVFELIVTIVIIVLFYYFVRVANNLPLALIFLIFGIVAIWSLRHIMRKSGMKVYQSSRGGRANALSTEGKIVIALFSGMVFAGSILIIVTELIGPLSTYFRVLFIIILGVVGAFIGNTIRKTLQKA